jgi:hypothetical protein
LLIGSKGRVVVVAVHDSLLGRGTNRRTVARRGGGRDTFNSGDRVPRPWHDPGMRIPETVRIKALVAGAQQWLWRPAAGCGLPTGADKGRWLAEHIVSTWEKLDRPCDERAVHHALGCAERRIAAHDDERAVLVHGDVHQWNPLRSPAVFAFVDPDGLLADAVRRGPDRRRSLTDRPGRRPGHRRASRMPRPVGLVRQPHQGIISSLYVTVVVIPGRHTRRR